MAWPTWTQYENFGAIHNVPLATKANGMAGMDAELKINSPLHVKHLQNMMDLLKEGVFKYGGRDGKADALSRRASAPSSTAPPGCGLASSARRSFSGA
jgi:sn-glycerol 3-phosphate transport system substrate-binding protein